jgi:hypothetical protein
MTTFTVKGNEIYQDGNKAFTCSSYYHAMTVTDTLNANVRLVIKGMEIGQDLGENCKDLAIKLGVSSLHGMYLPRAVVRF